MDAIFGMEFPLLLKFAISFAVVLILIGVAAFVVRRFGARGLTRLAPRGRVPRLAVVDSAAIDARRNLVIVRRDNVEHLLLVGGPTDVLVESNISPVPLHAGRDADASTRPAVAAPSAAAPAWTAGNANWPSAAPTETPVRVEPVATTEPRIEARPQPVRNDPVFVPEPFDRVEPVAPVPAFEPAPSVSPTRTPQVAPFASRDDVPSVTPPARPADLSAIPAVAAALDLDEQRDAMNGKPGLSPHPSVAVAPAPPPPAQKVAARPSEPDLVEDQNLADMAQRLEAALRRPIASGARAAPRPAAAPPQRQGPPPVRPATAVVAPTISVVTPPVAPQPGTPPSPGQSEESAYENLQREMASLLGRKPGSS